MSDGHSKIGRVELLLRIAFGAAAVIAWCFTPKEHEWLVFVVAGAISFFLGVCALVHGIRARAGSRTSMGLGEIWSAALCLPMSLRMGPVSVYVLLMLVFPYKRLGAALQRRFDGTPA